MHRLTVLFSMFLTALFATFLTTHCATASGASGIEGKWESLAGQSTDIDLYGSLSVDVRFSDTHLTLIRQFGKERIFRDSLRLPLDGSQVSVAVNNRVFPTNVFMGLSMPVGGTRKVSAKRESPGLFRVEETFQIVGSQGSHPESVTHRFELSPDGEILTYDLTRSTRTSGPPMTFRLKRSGSKEAYAITLEDNWEVHGSLDVQAMLISLQGIVNKSGPLVYILYPKDWPFTYVQSVYDFYRDKRHYTFRTLKSPEEALRTLVKVRERVCGMGQEGPYIAHRCVHGCRTRECRCRERGSDSPCGAARAEDGGGFPREVHRPERRPDLCMGLRRSTGRGAARSSSSGSAENTATS